MHIDFSSSCPTIVYFPAFSGGKFIMNCLSLSKHAVPQNKKIADYLIDNPDNYNYRLTAVMSTLPPLNDMKNWRKKWEFGDTEFYNGSVKKLLHNWKHNKNIDKNLNYRISNLVSKNMCFFFTAHGGPNEVNQYINVWPNAKVITLINSKNFWNVAINLKQQNIALPNFSDYAGNECQSKYQLLKGNSWPEWNEFEHAGYDISKCSNVTATIRQEIEQFYPLQTAKNQVLFNIDDCIFDTDRFLNSMKQLYVQMGFDDFKQDLVETFYTAYISLHI